MSSFRSHLPPPFFVAKDETNRIRYPSEARSQHLLNEDRSNYGTGGYYGNTYNQELYELERSPAQGYRDSYRQLGDRRYSQDPHVSWRDEYFSRHGYRSLDDRSETGRREAQQNHRGKGPRSYRRADSRILDDVNVSFYEDPFLDATDIETAVRNGEVILSGTVEDRMSKRRAEDLAERIAGVINVENRLRIRR